MTHICVGNLTITGSDNGLSLAKWRLQWRHACVIHNLHNYTSLSIYLKHTHTNKHIEWIHCHLAFAGDNYTLCICGVQIFIHIINSTTVFWSIWQPLWASYHYHYSKLSWNLYKSAVVDEVFNMLIKANYLSAERYCSDTIKLCQ